MDAAFPILVAGLFDRKSRVLILLMGAGPLQRWMRRLMLGRIIDRTDAQGDGPYSFGSVVQGRSEYGTHWPEAVKMLTDYCAETGLSCTADKLTAVGKTDAWGGEVEIYRAQVRPQSNDDEKQ